MGERGRAEWGRAMRGRGKVRLQMGDDRSSDMEEGMGEEGGEVRVEGGGGAGEGRVDGECERGAGMEVAAYRWMKVGIRDRRERRGKSKRRGSEGGSEWEGGGWGRCGQKGVIIIGE